VVSLAFLTLQQCLGSESVGSARFWLKKYADPRIRIQVVKYQPKTAKKNFFTPEPKSELLKIREIIKISSFLNGSSSFT